MQETDYFVKEQIQKLLFEHPFFHWCPKDAGVLNLLVIGDGKYAAEFVDQALQTGQMMHAKLQIFWCIGDSRTRINYLEKRPALTEFILVDGLEDTWDDQDFYGALFFKRKEESLDAFSETCRYIFAATDDVAENMELAELFKQVTAVDCLAAYLSDPSVDRDDRKPQLELQQEVCPIQVSFSGAPDEPEFVEAEEARQTIHSMEELERMAFNTHRIWEGEGNLDYALAKKRFQEPYNRLSSIAFVLSIPYKLRSIGIDEANPYLAAEKLWKLLQVADINQKGTGNEKKTDSNAEADTILRELAELEHRRWVLDRVTAGATRLVDDSGKPDYNYCLQERTLKKMDADGNLRMHPCIVKSATTHDLQSGIYADPKNWDKKNAADDMLDALDRTSIELHRIMYQATQKIRKNPTESQEYLQNLRINIVNLTMDDGSIPNSFSLSSLRSYLKRDFDRFQFCIENVLDGSYPYAAQFGTYERCLRESLSKLEGKLWELQAGGTLLGQVAEAYQEIQELVAYLFPAVESALYRDFKYYDKTLCEHIPFILTGKQDIHICMALGESSSINAYNDFYFQSVASATALYAQRITYFYVYEQSLNTSILKSKLKAIRNYFVFRAMSPEIDVRFLYPVDMSSRARTPIENVLRTARELGHIQEYELITFMEDTLVDQVQEIVSNCGADYFDGTTRLVHSSLTNARIIARLAADREIPYFEFDSQKKRFLNCPNCDYLRFARLSSFIQVEDMFAMMNAQDKEYNYPDFADDYKKFWEIYCGDATQTQFAVATRCWTKLQLLLTSKIPDLEIVNKAFYFEDKRERLVVLRMLD